MKAPKQRPPLLETVETALGPVPVDDLGIILPHEHGVLLWGDHRQYHREHGNQELFDVPAGYRRRFEHEEKTLFREARRCGATALVESTPIGCVRTIPMIQHASRQTGLHVILSTGLYLERTHPDWITALTVEQLAALFVGELTRGIADTGAKAWMIKIASNDQALSAADQKAFRAAALASRETGAAITTHSCAAIRPHFDFLVAAGADPARLYLGHADFRGHDDPGAENRDHLYVAERGGHLIFTCWGVQHFVDQDTLAGRVLALVKDGYAGAVLLSTDYALAFSSDHMSVISFEYECPRRTHAFLFRYTLPFLRKKGVSEALLRRFTVDNPKAMLRRPGNRKAPMDKSDR